MADIHPLQSARDAFARRAWREAREELASADASGELEPQDLEQLAIAAYMTGDPQQHFEALERAHDAYLARERQHDAARCALWLALHRAARYEADLAEGWRSRAEELLEAEPGEHVERGYLRVHEALRSLSAGELEDVYQASQEALSLARRHGDADLVTLAQHLQGRARLRQGQVAEGMSLLEEAMVPVTWDGLSPIVTGTVYRSVLEACREVHAHRQADAWSEALVRWCAKQPEMVAFSGECLVYRAESLQARGDWDAALEDVKIALRDYLEVMDRRTAGHAFYRYGELMRLRVEPEAAEEAYREASLRGWEPQPGLAHLRVAQGRAEAAAASLRRTLDENDDALVRARLLPALAEVLLLIGERDEARQACDALARVVEHFDGQALRATYDHVRGALALAEERPGEAVDALQLALTAWEDLQVPYEAARIRVLLARAHQALGEEGTAGMELWSARTTFEELGARSDVLRVDALAE